MTLPMEAFAGEEGVFLSAADDEASDDVEDFHEMNSAISAMLKYKIMSTIPTRARRYPRRRPLDSLCVSQCFSSE